MSVMIFCNICTGATRYLNSETLLLVYIPGIEAYADNHLKEKKPEQYVERTVSSDFPRFFAKIFKIVQFPDLSSFPYV